MGSIQEVWRVDSKEFSLTGNSATHSKFLLTSKTSWEQPFFTLNLTQK